MSRSESGNYPPRAGVSSLRAGLCSIVIPVFNAAHLTQQCLQAIRDCTPDVPYEVVVVDNASSDSTPALLASNPGVRVLRNDQNHGFAVACNQGAAIARGEYLLFLNNDTIPRAGWLRPLIQTLQTDAKIGIAGSKLIYPQSGLIQHAGVAVDPDGNPFNMYRLFPADLPEANVSRVMPGVTGASMLMRTRQFLELGGFDQRYLNGYEDVELCLRARRVGLASYYCHTSEFVHFESMTPGRQSFDLVNNKLLRSEWAETLAECGEYPWLAEMKHALVRYGDDVFKLSTDGRFVLMRGKTIYECDRLPPRVEEIRNPAMRLLTRIRLRLRYWSYRESVRLARREALRAA